MHYTLGVITIQSDKVWVGAFILKGFRCRQLRIRGYSGKNYMGYGLQFVEILIKHDRGNELWVI